MRSKRSASGLQAFHQRHVGLGGEAEDGEQLPGVDLPPSMRIEISTSCSRVSSGTWPICFRYMRTGSCIPRAGQPSAFSSPSALAGEAPSSGASSTTCSCCAVVRLLEFLRAGRCSPAGFVDVVVGDVALLLRQLGRPARRSWPCARRARLRGGGGPSAARRARPPRPSPSCRAGRP